MKFKEIYESKTYDIDYDKLEKEGYDIHDIKEKMKTSNPFPLTGIPKKDVDQVIKYLKKFKIDVEDIDFIVTDVTLYLPEIFGNLSFVLDYDQMAKDDDFEIVLTRDSDGSYGESFGLNPKDMRTIYNTIN